VLLLAWSAQLFWNRTVTFPWCEWCVCKVLACNTVNNTNTIATSCTENVIAQSETSVDTSQYKQLSLPKISESLEQVAVYFIRELDGYFILSKTPEELRLPLVFRSISDPFAKRWMLTACGQLKSYDDFKKAFSELLWDGTRRSEIRCQVYQGGYNWRGVSPNITLDTPTWPACFRQPCPTRTYLTL